MKNMKLLLVAFAVSTTIWDGGSSAIWPEAGASASGASP